MEQHNKTAAIIICLTLAYFFIYAYIAESFIAVNGIAYAKEDYDNYENLFYGIQKTDYNHKSFIRLLTNINGYVHDFGYSFFISTMILFACLMFISYSEDIRFGYMLMFGTAVSFAITHVALMSQMSAYIFYLYGFVLWTKNKKLGYGVMALSCIFYLPSLYILGVFVIAKCLHEKNYILYFASVFLFGMIFDLMGYDILQLTIFSGGYENPSLWMMILLFAYPPMLVEFIKKIRETNGYERYLLMIFLFFGLIGHGGRLMLYVLPWMAWKTRYMAYNLKHVMGVLLWFMIVFLIQHTGLISEFLIRRII